MATSAQKIPFAPDENAWKFFVFRKVREPLPANLLVRELQQELVRLAAGAASPINALVRAGELETGMADAKHAEKARFAEITDIVAARSCAQPADLNRAMSLLRCEVPGEVTCSHPEGFSYYGLHPLDFADAACAMAHELRHHVAVIGVRSVGAALSAIVTAALKGKGTSAERITVRPEGEPYHRKTRLTISQQQWLSGRLKASSDFLIVDEGPGFSGSTLVSVAHALEEAGVPPSNIRIICSRPVHQLHDKATVAALERYKPVAVAYGRRIPAECARNVGGGLWRELLIPSPDAWPASWTDLERIKHIASDGRSLFKFEGFGRIGALACRQAEALAEARLSPPFISFDNGFARYKLIHGRALKRSDISRELLYKQAQYCAFRARYCCAEGASAGPLLNMVEQNLALEFGKPGPVLKLPVCRPVYPDCRMMPHEWVQNFDGRIYKTDAVGHAEGHQLPGPVDIAWDLAGVIAEWDLRADEREFFLRSYARESGDDPAARITEYLLAYLAHRLGHCRMGAASMHYTPDGELLRHEYERHRCMLSNLLGFRSQVFVYKQDMPDIKAS